MFRSALAWTNLLEVSGSINISPRMGRRATMFCCTSNLNPRIPRWQAQVEWLNQSAKITKAWSGRAISVSLLQGLSVAAVRGRR
jgi:hypothetical protein